MAPEAKFLVPDWRGYSRLPAYRVVFGPQGYIGWQAGTTTLCQIRLYPPCGGSGFIRNMVLWYNSHEGLIYPRLSM